MNAEILQDSQKFYFKKISNTKWCAFNEKKEPIFIHNNAIEIIYNVAKEVLQQGQTMQIKNDSKSFVNSLLKNIHVQKQYPAIVTDMKKWEEENRIQFVS